ncbi:hypothetical protein ACFVJM_39590 [Streptomyces virginiae]|uniref:hypothetical protein n=1 Tax=Streptomyces virginiae TaxID=1961 RepID=UPI003627EE6B
MCTDRRVFSTLSRCAPGIWRRTQQEETSANSGWTGEGDARRRIVHYQRQYGLVDTTAAPALAMTQLYLYHSVAAPLAEIEVAWEENHAMLSEGGWKYVGAGRFELGDLRVHMIRMEQHPEDLRAGRRLPADYEVIDTVFTSLNCFPPRAVRRRPWEVLTHGVRVKDTPGKPVYADDLAQLTDFLPFQVEVDCGVSYEAGIPPLHRLHEMYHVNEIEAQPAGRTADAGVESGDTSAAGPPPRAGIRVTAPPDPTGGGAVVTSRTGSEALLRQELLHPS